MPSLLGVLFWQYWRAKNELHNNINDSSRLTEAATAAVQTGTIQTLLLCPPPEFLNFASLVRVLMVYIHGISSLTRDTNQFICRRGMETPRCWLDDDHVPNLFIFNWKLTSAMNGRWWWRGKEQQEPINWKRSNLAARHHLMNAKNVGEAGAFQETLAKWIPDMLVSKQSHICAGILEWRGKRNRLTDNEGQVTLFVSIARRGTFNFGTLPPFLEVPFPSWCVIGWLNWLTVRKHKHILGVPSRPAYLDPPEPFNQDTTDSFFQLLNSNPISLSDVLEMWTQTRGMRKKFSPEWWPSREYLFAAIGCETSTRWLFNGSRSSVLNIHIYSLESYLATWTTTIQSVVVAGHTTIHQLNQEWRARDNHTIGLLDILVIK